MFRGRSLSEIKDALYRLELLIITIICGCICSNFYLISSPAGISHDVDDGAPAGRARVLSVISVAAVVVILGSHLYTCGLRDVKNYIFAANKKST